MPDSSRRWAVLLLALCAVYALAYLYWLSGAVTRGTQVRSLVADPLRVLTTPGSIPVLDPFDFLLVLVALVAVVCLLALVVDHVVRVLSSAAALTSPRGVPDSLVGSSSSASSVASGPTRDGGGAARP